jgi:hypothetical protein
VKDPMALYRRITIKRNKEEMSGRFSYIAFTADAKEKDMPSVPKVALPTIWKGTNLHEMRGVPVRS